MKCTICRQGQTKPGTTTVILERDDSDLEIRGVPTLVCDDCGEEYVEESVAERLHAIVDELSTDGMSSVDYHEFLMRTREPTAQRQGAQPSQSSEPTRKEIWLGCTVALLAVLIMGLTVYTFVWGVPSSVASRMHALASGPFAFLLPVSRYGLVAALTLGLLYPLIWGNSRKYLRFFAHIRPLIVLQCIVVLGVVAAFGLTLRKYAPFLDRSWLYMFPITGGDSMNVTVLPATVRYLGPVYVLLLMLNLPALAHSEEVSFRKGTRDWRHGIKRSLRFGLGHCIMGVPIFAGLALSIGGLWFTYQYFNGGVERSTVHHLTYNMIVVTVLAYLVLSGQF